MTQPGTPRRRMWLVPVLGCAGLAVTCLSIVLVFALVRWAGRHGGPAITTTQAVTTATAAVGASRVMTTTSAPGATADLPVPDADTVFPDDPTIDLLAQVPPSRDLVELAVRMGRATGPIRSATPTSPVAHRLGDTARFWVHDIEGQHYFQVDATLEAVADNVCLWVQQGESVDREALGRGAQSFSDDIMPRLRAVFGPESTPGIDADPRVYVLHHENIPSVAGYFSSTDLLPVEVDPYSNRHEMFYVNLSIYRPGSYPYLGLLAHEFQHMIHYRYDPDEAVWVNEGLSDLAAGIAGYGEQTGEAFINTPDTGLTRWEADTADNTTHYAAAYAFFAFLHARYGDAVLRRVVAASANGPSGVEEALRAIGQPRAFDALFLDWVAANVVHDNGRAGARYSYGPHEIDRVDPRALEPGGTHDTVAQYGTDYYDVTGMVRNGRLDLTFRGEPTVGLLSPAPERPGRLWWSNTGDSIDSRLTRTFDLSGAASAALSFRMWHALEPNWDYAYFSVSTDDGQTWQRLSTPDTVDENANGNNYGAGLTGGSGGWVEETLDLTPYVGGPVMVRFEVINDDAISLAGLALDDLRLDAIGFRDDAESDAGWTAEGWLRVDPALPQRWGVQAIVDSPAGVVVHPVAVSPDGTAPITLDAVPGDATVTLAVSAMTPATRNPGTYGIDAAP